VRFLLGALLAMLSLMPCDPGGRFMAAEAPAQQKAARGELEIQFFKDRAEEVAASSSLDEVLRNQLGELYRKTIGSLQGAASLREAARRFEEAIHSAPDEAAAVRAELAKRAAQGDAPAPDLGALPLAEIEQRLVEEKGRQTSLASRLSELKGEIAIQEGRPAAVRQYLAEAEAALSEPPAAQDMPVIGEQPEELVQARRWANEAEAEELRAKVLMLGQELASQPMRLALLEAQRDQVERDLDAARARVAQLETLANQIRLQQTEQAKIQAQVAELTAADKHPLVADLATRNTRLSQDVEALAAEIETIKRAERRAAEEAVRIDESFKSTRKKIELAGVSPILGQVLQEQRRNLPATGEARKKVRGLEQKIATTSLSQILLEEERDELRDVPAYVERLSSALPSEVQQEIGDELGKLAQSRLALIDQALSVHRLYLQGMAELDLAQRRLADVVEQFDGFLAERLLWVRSSQVAGLDTLHLIPGQLADLLAPEQWRSLLRTLVEVGTLVWIIPAAIFAAVVRLRRRQLRQALTDSGKHVGSLLHDSLGDTVRALGLTLLIALPWPLVVASTGWGLLDSYDSAMFTKRVGQALLTLSMLLFELRALQLLIVPGGLAQVHFGWREPGLRRLRRDLGWFLPLLVATAALTLLTFASATQYWGSGLGRAAFVLVMGVVATFFFRLTRPNGGTLSVLLADNQQSRTFRLRHLWFVLLVGSPLVAVAISLAGYMYTAATLIRDILNTVWFSLLVIVLHQFVIRWLVLNQRKLRLQAARERRRSELEARAADGHPEESELLLARDLDEPKIDLNALDAASRKLTNNAFLLVVLVGAWWIWRDMLPALGILDEVTLWSYSKPGVELPVPVTLAGLGLAVLIFVVMMLATRQLPAFLEVVLLQRLGMTQGSRYTAVTLTKYTLVAVGISWIFSTLGGSWSEIQWIFAALGVGIGFGLQEIVANFISGLIILFERPIRVGDVVTVGNTDGVVTRIRIRATTIRNWDQKELLVPNKNFITQELLNWSLSDQTTRILIRVGVAYGSDVQRALLIMEEAARKHVRVLAEPPPFVVFESFGDNALQLSLRCYIDNLEYRLRTVTDLNLAINQAMAEAGIEIAFPQRDVHLDTRRPLDVRIHRERPQGEGRGADG